MIEGLKVTIGGVELRTLCMKRAAWHVNRAAVYAAQEKSMVSAEIEATRYSGGDPKRALRDKYEQHEAEAGEMEFIAKHLKLDADYRLDASDLSKLGISKRGW